jgi:hypothetical protein
VDGTRTRAESDLERYETTTDLAADPVVQSPRRATVRDHSRPVETIRGTERAPTEAELERGILDAINLGALDVARTLSERLAKREASGRP